MKAGGILVKIVNSYRWVRVNGNQSAIVGKNTQAVVLNARFITYFK